MAKFNVVGVVTGSKYLGCFEAETAEEAVEMALKSDKASVSVCHHCSEEVEDPEVQSARAELAEE